MPTPPLDSANSPASVIARSVRPPRARSNKRGGVGWFLLLILIGVPTALWASGARPDQWFKADEAGPKTVTVDRGDVRSYVVEGGALESADQAIVRCKVEAVLGVVSMNGGGAAGGQQGRGGNTAQSGGTTASAGSATTASTSASGGTTTASTAGKAASTAQAVAAGQASANATAQAATQASTASAGNIIQKPTIKSFTMVITPHTPLRPSTAASNNTSNRAQNLQQQQDQSGQTDKQGSTTILKILPEGTPVKEGDIVCWLDSSQYEDELKSQMIRYTQARSWVEQARYALNAAEIELDEYVNGIYPQDRMLINQYIETCKISLNQAQNKLDWEMSMLNRKLPLRTESQVRGSRFELQRAQLALLEAERMQDRLFKYTMPKLKTNLEAKIAAVTADLEAQNAAFSLEEQRKRRLESAVENCTMRAPRNGIVVYYVKSNGWGRVENEIAEGVTVREDEPVFLIPDPTRMRVSVKVNESKVAFLHRGVPALVRVEAFAGKVLRGELQEVTAIPTPAAGPFSDVKMYSATVSIDEGFQGLRTGMNARVEFLVGDRRDVPRVPLKTLRWFDGDPYVAVPAGIKGHRWKQVTLGVMSEGFAEVQMGLEPGDPVIADPSKFDPPTSDEREQAKKLASRGVVGNPQG